ncbi:MAG: ATP-binding protein, partial [Candidatus Eiseniibacteriota bacterium]
MSLRTRLSLIFVGLAVLPCLALTLIVSHQLTRAIEFWTNPGMQSSFQSSVAVARESLRLLEEHLTTTVTLAARAGTADQTDLDVWRIYERTAGGGYALRAAEASDTGRLLEPERLAEAVAAGPGQAIHLDTGWIVAVAPIDSAAHRVLLGGYGVSPELGAQIATARQGAQHIGELGIYKAVYQGWVWISALLASLLLVGGSVLLARRLARGLTRPLEEVVSAMTQLGRGDRVAALAPPGDREMGVLVRSFNRMAAELERSRRELQRAERLAAWREIARRVAHEIKNPLTPIQFAIHRLKRHLADSGAPEEAVRDSLDAILGEVESLRAIAESFSRIAKLPEPELEHLQVEEILREVVALYEQPGIERRLSIDGGLPPVLGDRRHLRQVFHNLIQNAVEAMPEGGTLTVRAARADGGGVAIEIANAAGAIPEDDLERIWEPYFTSKQSGTGLGLPVVAKIISDHGGRIELENQPDGGVVARFTLPAAPEGR